MEDVRAHEKEITGYALERLSSLPEVTIYGPRNVEERIGVVSFNLGDVHPHDVGQVVDSFGVAIRGAHHCAQPLMRRLDCAATARASFYIYNTKAEVDLLVSALQEAARYFSVQQAEIAR
jgi:cysteine desulfurase/selenocysteine lyase